MVFPKEFIKGPNMRSDSLQLCQGVANVFLSMILQEIQTMLFEDMELCVIPCRSGYSYSK